MWNKPVLNSYPCRSPINKTWLTDCSVEQHLGESKTVTRQVALAYQVVHHILGGCGWCRLRKQTSWKVNTTTMHVLYLLCAVHLKKNIYLSFLVHLKTKQKRRNKMHEWVSERNVVIKDACFWINTPQWCAWQKNTKKHTMLWVDVWYSSTSRLDGDVCENKHHQRLTTSHTLTADIEK